MTYKFDQSSLLPGAYKNSKDNFAYLYIKANELPSQQAFGRTASELLTKGANLGEWIFIAPNEISENITHDWGEYDSMASRLAQKAMTAGRNVQLAQGGIDFIKNLVSGGSDAFIDTAKNFGNNAKQGYDTAKQNIKNVNAQALVSQAFSAAGSVLKEEKAFQGKVDTAYIYQDTRRREYSFTFMLGDMGGSGDRLLKQIIEPVQKLESLSCPTLNKDDLIAIGFPAVFTIETSPVSFLKIDAAALTAVQPTYFGPYIDGYPTQCQLQITFTEIVPLYRYMIDQQQNNIITTNKTA